MKRFLTTFQDFPDLQFDIGIEPTNKKRVAHRLIIVAHGNLKSRDEWQAAFDAWCALQGQVPKFRRGNDLTGQTVAYAVFLGAHPIADFIVRWIGVESVSIDQTVGNRLSRLEQQVAALRRRMAHPLHVAASQELLDPPNLMAPG